MVPDLPLGQFYCKISLQVMSRSSRIDIKTIPPGSKAIEWVRRDERVISQSYTRAYPLVVERGEGVFIEDVDGNRYLDFTSGIAVTSTGHCHPSVVDRIIQQSRRLIHMSGTDFYYPSEIRLAEKLTEITPGDHAKKVFFTNSGTESNEAAMKLARYNRKRPLYLSFYGGFYGRTMGSLSLSASKEVHRRGFAPFVPGVVHVPYAYCYRCVYGLEKETCHFYCVTWIADELFRTAVPPEEVSAIFIEPIQGEGGYVVPPEGYLRKIADLAKEYGLLLVVDEVQTGMGRTGKIFACEHEGVIPDIITLAKGIASGMPLGAMVASSSIMTWERGSHANTFGGNPIACEAALATIELLEGGLVDNAAEIGSYILSKLKEMQGRHPLMGDVRGKGLMIGIEFVRGGDRKDHAVEERNAIIEGCFKRGLLLLGCGRSVIRLMPPLILTKDDADTALTLLEESIDEVEKGRYR